VETKHSSKTSILQVKYTLYFKTFSLSADQFGLGDAPRLNWCEGIPRVYVVGDNLTTSGLVLFGSLSDLVFELFYLDILGNLTSLCFTFAGFVLTPQDGCGTQYFISNISINMQFTLIHVHLCI